MYRLGLAAVLFLFGTLPSDHTFEHFRALSDLSFQQCNHCLIHFRINSHSFSRLKTAIHLSVGATIVSEQTM